MNSKAVRCDLAGVAPVHKRVGLCLRSGQPRRQHLRNVPNPSSLTLLERWTGPKISEEVLAHETHQPMTKILRGNIW